MRMMRGTRERLEPTQKVGSTVGFGADYDFGETRLRGSLLSALLGPVEEDVIPRVSRAAVTAYGPLSQR